MTDVIIAPRMEDLTSDTEAILRGCLLRVRPCRVRSDSGNWVQPVWPPAVPVEGVAITAKLDPLAIPYELELTGPDGRGGITTLIHEYRLVTDSASPLYWEDLELTTPDGDPAPTNEIIARLDALEAALGSISGGASTLGEITDMSAFMRTVNDDTSSSAARTTLGAAATSHTHVATTDLTATGTKNSTTFLRGDDTWATPPAAGSPAWDDVTGKPSTFTPAAHTHTASDVTDFTSAVLDALPDVFITVSWDGTGPFVRPSTRTDLHYEVVGPLPAPPIVANTGTAGMYDGDRFTLLSD